jgi:hypothetical protein
MPWASIAILAAAGAYGAPVIAILDRGLNSRLGWKAPVIAAFWPLIAGILLWERYRS